MLTAHKNNEAETDKESAPMVDGIVLYMPLAR